MLVQLYGRIIDLGASPSKLMMQRWTGQLSPEPETVAWLEAIPKGSVFWDIGASVGTHSIRAAVLGLQVTAFEPHAGSWADLVATVERNRLPVVVLNWAVTHTVGRGQLVRGRSKYTFALDDTGLFVGTPAVSLDSLLGASGFTPPGYVKIDVDGNEEDIIKGGERLFREYVKEALIEVDPAIHHKLIGMMQDLGFKFDPAQVSACMIRGGKYDGMANFIFRKE